MGTKNTLGGRAVSNGDCFKSGINPSALNLLLICSAMRSIATDIITMKIENNYQYLFPPLEQWYPHISLSIHGK